MKLISDKISGDIRLVINDDIKAKVVFEIIRSLAKHIYNPPIVFDEVLLHLKFEVNEK